MNRADSLIRQHLEEGDTEAGRVARSLRQHGFLVTRVGSRGYSVRHPWTLHNGTVDPDGSYRLHGGNIIRERSGRGTAQLRNDLSMLGHAVVEHRR